MPSWCAHARERALSLSLSLSRYLRCSRCVRCAHLDPHEEKQKALLQRITGSVARLNEVVKEINTQIEVRWELSDARASYSLVLTLVP